MSLLVARIGVSSAPISFALPGKIQQQRAATTRRSFAKPRAIGSKCKRQSPLCRRGDDVDIADRVVAAVAYTLPLLDGLKYGTSFFQQFPAATIILVPLQPLVSFFYGFPFASFLLFLSLYIFVANNPRFSRFVRFNTLQAILVDVLLIIPGLLGTLFAPPGGGFGLQLYIMYKNTIFLYVLFCYVYGVLGCLAGKLPRLPLVSQAADQQLP